jgi:prophage regulatory protein
MQNIKILRLPALKQTTGISRSTIYAMVKAGTFPSPIKLGRRAVGWIESDVHSWIDSRVSTAKGVR